MKRIRPITWIWIAFNVLVIVGTIISSSNALDKCIPPSEPLVCLASLGGGYTAYVIWIPGNLTLGAIWLITWLSNRRCAACRTFLKRGEFICPSCGSDMRTGGATTPIREGVERVRSFGTERLPRSAPDPGRSSRGSGGGHEIGTSAWDDDK